MRLLLSIILIFVIVHPAIADTTNRALQVSPVPGLFVGGVGLLCKTSENNVAFVLLTKDRETAGSATFEDDDVTYDMMSLKGKTPDFYTYSANVDLIINRQSLALETGRESYSCEIQNISDLHRAAERNLKMLLSENKI